MNNRSFFALGCAAGLALGAWLGWSLALREQAAPAAENSIAGSLSAKSELQAAYLPKDKPSDADVEIKAALPAVKVSINGKEETFPLISSESSKFEQGKLTVKQETTAAIRIDVPVIDASPQNALGYGYGTRKLEELTYRRRMNKRLGWYVRAEGRLFTGPAELKAGAAGLEVYF